MPTLTTSRRRASTQIRAQRGNPGSPFIFLEFCYHPVIQNNESYSNGEHGIYHSNSGDFPTIQGSKLHHNFSAGVHMNGDRNFTPGDGIISFAVVEKNIV